MRRYGYGDGSGSSKAGTGVNSALAAAGVLAKMVVSAEELLVASSRISELEAAGAVSMLAFPVSLDADEVDADLNSGLAVLLGLVNSGLVVEFFLPEPAFAIVPLVAAGKAGDVLLRPPPELFLGPLFLSPLFLSLLLLPLSSPLLEDLDVGVAV
jgi:hypothetical protein